MKQEQSTIQFESLVTRYVSQTFKVAVIKLYFQSKHLSQLIVDWFLTYLYFKDSWKSICQTAKVTNDLLIAFDSALIVLLVLLDLSATFSSQYNTMLLQRTEHNEAIKGSLLQWCESHLSVRLQFVSVTQKLVTEFCRILCWDQCFPVLLEKLHTFSLQCKWYQPLCTIVTECSVTPLCWSKICVLTVAGWN